jgi:urease accessory protein
VASESGLTRLAGLTQHAPLRLLFPRVAADEPLTACLINSAGGLVGGDCHQIDIEAGAGTRLMVIGQAAEKIYRSIGAECRIGIDLAAREGAWLEWLPQETILFDGARLFRGTRLAVAKSARALAGDFLVFGRIGRGEIFRRGSLKDRFSVEIDGRLAWADALDLGTDPALALDHPAGFGGASSAALMVLHAPDPDAHRDSLRALPVPDGVRFGASVVSGLLVARWLGWHVPAMRRHFAEAWVLLRDRAGGLAPRLPSLWTI